MNNIVICNKCHASRNIEVADKCPVCIYGPASKVIVKRNPERVKQATNLRKQGMTYEKIGEIMGISRQAAHLLVNKKHHEK